MPRERPYYSVRTGKNPQGGGFGLASALRLFLSVYEQLDRDGYFQEYLGFGCVDAGFIPGKLGEDIEAAILLDLRKEGLWPIREKLEHYSEDDFFDMEEYLYDHATEGDKGYFHGFVDCGWHYETFKTDDSGKREYRSRINRVLRAYGKGYELDERGEIFSLPEPGYENILSANLPSNDPENIEAKVQAAVYKFTRARSTLDERRDAIRDLADVLEFLRPQLKTVLDSEDESDLFNIANNFGIRHHNQNQKTNYDRNIWYSWLFYYYLSTIHASLRLIEKRS
ncbi:MAG: hypothetical protein ACFHX7_24475 [Pseudomonadota bacterium]